MLIWGWGKPSDAKSLFEELSNDAMTMWDALFWMLIGAILASLVWWGFYAQAGT